MVIKGIFGGGVLQKGHENFCMLGFISFQIEVNKKVQRNAGNTYIVSINLCSCGKILYYQNPTTNFPLLECGYFFHLYFFSFFFQIILYLNIELYNYPFREVFPIRMRAKWMCLASKMKFGKMGKSMSTLKLGTLLGWCMNRLLNNFIS